MADYKLTKAADLDFDRIFEFGIDRFGLEQALKYQNEITERFREIADSPKLYPVADQIDVKYRKSVCGSHSIYYLIEEDYILIVRILGQQNLNKYFKQDEQDLKDGDIE